MSIGIYMLSFTGSNLVYIGQSVNIEKRYRNHKSDLNTNNCTSPLLQDTYNTFGVPILTILIKCSKDNLLYYENMFIEKYRDSCINYFSKNGPKLNCCQHTEEVYIQIFKLLILGKSPKDIKEELSVSIQIINGIFYGNKHTWLKDRFPEDYKIMESMSTPRTKNYPNVLSPDGKEYTIVNCSKFSSEHGLNQGAMSKLLSGKAQSHKGWKLA
jgi:hypothetical protein